MIQPFVEWIAVAIALFVLVPVFFVWLVAALFIDWLKGKL